jgi:DMSO reductase family type II enzyme heme b subunit
MWKADLQEQDDGASAVEEMRAKGHLVKIATGDEEATLTERMADLLEPQPPESQNVWGQGTWEDGTWRVVMRRALDTGDPQDAILQEGKLIPLSFQAWDGSNGERGLMMSISSWQFLLLETPTPANVYLYTLLGVLVAAVGEAGLVWRLRRRRR